MSTDTLSQISTTIRYCEGTHQPTGVLSYKLDTITTDVLPGYIECSWKDQKRVRDAVHRMKVAKREAHSRMNQNPNRQYYGDVQDVMDRWADTLVRVTNEPPDDLVAAYNDCAVELEAISSARPSSVTANPPEVESTEESADRIWSNPDTWKALAAIKNAESGIVNGKVVLVALENAEARLREALAIIEILKKSITAS